MSATHDSLGAAGSNCRLRRFSATGRSWLESVVWRNLRAVLAAISLSRISLATMLTQQACPRATSSAWMRGLPELALAGESIGTLGLEGLLPGAEDGHVDAEGAGGLGDGVALLGDELDGLGHELGGVGASRSCHAGPPKSEFTLLTGCPPFVGRSTGQMGFGHIVVWRRPVGQGGKLLQREHRPASRIVSCD